MDLMSFITPGTGKVPSFGTAISAQNGSQASKSSFDDFLKSRLTGTDVKAASEKAQTERSVKRDPKAEAGKVIDGLSIPAEQKEKLKKELDSLETEEDAVAFLENLEEILMLNGISVEETVAKFSEAFVAEDAQNAAGSTALDSAMLKALKAKGYTQAEQNLTDSEQQAAKEAFEKLSMPKEAKISKEEVKIAEIVKPLTAEDVPSEEQIAKTSTADIPDMDVGETVIKPGQNILTEQEQPEVKIVTPRDINKIADFVQYTKAGDQKKLTIQLMPKELGKLHIELVDNAGKISARITMESDQARNLLVNNAESVRQQLEAKGIVLEKMEFFFAEKDSKDGTDQQFFRKKNSGGSKSEFAVGDITEEETDPSRGLYA
ncbi:MAG: flagellar hook-length control protein FliK [Geovibrio sp.]|jgi:flagellar hook-length control protein FliK|uniref:flagellar hook-length control protein FliK n=1 Tax=Geovibrio ferrireducens TaxID=46201 RepID=UPI002245AAB9|nr:flagellar hook-length control protein FliK [Geovibrio ferrireducens]MCD8492342.1 flagellar hook-length control protein FliK [Geovibrio sp.]MCD8569482.1 flagellar hook-length control protein FliK [Geovibrio sp.]